ncbi:unnamed protein product [Amoebophrya sp. A120]|nr:unnamed protein product [Amoebophrya sp. A120]|eukprot:GSA120T00007766001.1
MPPMVQDFIPLPRLLYFFLFAPSMRTFFLLLLAEPQLAESGSGRTSVQHVSVEDLEQNPELQAEIEAFYEETRRKKARQKEQKNGKTRTTTSAETSPNPDPPVSDSDITARRPHANKLYTTHSCVAAGNCLVENLCHGTDGRFIYVKSPAAIFDRPQQVYYDTRYSGEKHFKESNNTDGTVSFDLRSAAGMTATGYRHFLTSRVFEDIPSAAISSRLYHPILHPRLRDMRIIDGVEFEWPESRGGMDYLAVEDKTRQQAGVVEAEGSGAATTTLPRAGSNVVSSRPRSAAKLKKSPNGLPYPFWPPEQLNEEKSDNSDSEEDSEHGADKSQSRQKDAVQVIMGRLWPTDAGHTMMDNMSPIFRALKQWDLLDVDEESVPISPFVVNDRATGVDSIQGDEVFEADEVHLSNAALAGDTDSSSVVREEKDVEAEHDYSVITSPPGDHDESKPNPDAAAYPNLTIESDNYSCGDKQAALVARALQIADAKFIERSAKDNCPVLNTTEQLGMVGKFVRTMLNKEPAPASPAISSSETTTDATAAAEDTTTPRNTAPAGSGPAFLQMHVPNEDFGGRLPPSMRKFEGMYYQTIETEVDSSASAPAARPLSEIIASPAKNGAGKVTAPARPASSTSMNYPHKTRTLRIFSSPHFSFLDAQAIAKRDAEREREKNAALAGKPVADQPGRDMRYGGCRDECEARLLQAFTDGDRERLSNLDHDLPKGKCFRKVLIGWRGMQFFNVFDWLSRNSAPWRHDVSIGNSAEQLLGLRNYMLAKHGLLGDKKFMGLLERRKRVKVVVASSANSESKGSNIKSQKNPTTSSADNQHAVLVDRYKPSVLLLVKKVGRGSGYNCCHWQDPERLQSHLLKAFDHKISVQIKSWAGMPIVQQLWVMAETDLTISFAGADVMNFLFSPLYSGLISPYRLRNNKWERSYEIDRLWVNLPNRYLQQFGVNAVQKTGLSTLHEMTSSHGPDGKVVQKPGANQALLLAPWRQEKPRGLVRQRIVANLTEGTVNTEKANWPNMAFSDLLIIGIYDRPRSFLLRISARSHGVMKIWKRGSCDRRR